RGVVEVLPGEGEIRDDPARLEVANGQMIEDLIAEDDGLAEDRAGRIPGVDVGLQRIHDGVVLGLRRRRSGQGEGEGREQGESKGEATNHGGLLRRGESDVPARRWTGGASKVPHTSEGARGLSNARRGAAEVDKLARRRP